MRLRHLCGLTLFTLFCVRTTGNPIERGSLHYIHRSQNAFNDYEKAIQSVCNILAPYDSDQMFPGTYDIFLCCDCFHPRMVSQRCISQSPLVQFGDLVQSSMVTTMLATAFHLEARMKCMESMEF